MNRSSDNLTGSPSFTISTAKDAKGGWSAKCESLPSLPAQAGSDEIEAIRNMRYAVERHVMSGGRA